LISILEDIGKIKSGKKELREFAFTIGAALVVLSGIALGRGKGSCAYLFVSGVIFAGLGAAAPHVLKPLQKAWMAFSVVIGFFMSRLVLAVLFYVVVTPIGLLIRLLGKDMLDQRTSKDRPSYWRERPVSMKPRESYENQY